jgi:Mitochondrial carrier protein
MYVNHATFICKSFFCYLHSICSHSIQKSGPSEVIKQKVQAGIYKSTADAVSSTWQQNGILAFYEGYFGGIARDVPFRVAQLTSYELTKNLYIRLKRQRHDDITTRRGKRDVSSPNKSTLALTPGEAGTYEFPSSTLSSYILF